MSSVIINIGPVSTSTLKSVRLPPDWEILTIAQEVVAPSQTGGVALKPSMFAAYAATLGNDPLSAILQRAGNSKPDQVILFSFSAGHGLLDPLLLGSGLDPRILGVYSADSYYGLGLKAGYVKYANACFQTGNKFWLSTSNTKGGVTVHSGAESIAPFAQAIGLQPSTTWPAGMPQPASQENKSNVWWLDYEAEFSHVEHATKLGPTALNIWFDQMQGLAVPPSPLQPDPPGSNPPLVDLKGNQGLTLLESTAAFAGAAMLGYWGAKKFGGSRR